MRLLAHHQPEGGFRRLTADDPLCRANLNRIAAVQIAVTERRVKFKLGQHRTPEQRVNVAKALRDRGGAHDVATAEAIEWTLGQGAQG
jgi:transcriptional regulator